MSRHRSWIFLLVVSLLLAACGGGDGSTTGEGVAAIQPVVGEGVVRVGEPAPDFVLPTTSGEVLSLEELRGRAVIVNFWATWCGPCRAEMPELQAAFDALNPDGLEIIGVELASSGNREDSAAFLESVGVSFPIYRDESGVMEDRYIQRPAWPTTIFIDREGIVSFVQIGPMNRAFIEERLGELDF